jgi:dUTP pyrophosphatase
VAIPPGYAGLVLIRSGLAARHGIQCVNSPGLIDSGYRGEIAVIMLNTDKRDSFVVSRGDRIAQLLIQRVEEVALVKADELDDTSRGAGGFGSTGISRDNDANL